MTQSLKESLESLIQLLDELKIANEAVGETIDSIEMEGQQIGNAPENIDRMREWTDLATRQFPMIRAHGKMVDEILATTVPLERIAAKAVVANRGLRFASWFTIGVLAVVVASYLVTDLSGLTPASSGLLALSLGISGLSFIFLSVQLSRLEHGARIARQKLGEIQALQNQLHQAMPRKTG